MSSIGPLIETLRLTRQARGLTQQQVADAIGVTRVTITRWEAGQGDAHMADVLAYAEHLGLRLRLELTDTQETP